MIAGFHYMGCIFQDKTGIWVRGQFGPLIEELAKYLDHLYIIVDTTNVENNKHFEAKTDYLIGEDNVSIVSLGDYYSKIDKIISAIKVSFKNFFKKQKLDFILIRVPSRRITIINAIFKATPKVYLMGGEWGRDFSCLKGISLLRAKLFDTVTLESFKSSLVFVNNEILYENWKSRCGKILLTRTTTVKNENVAVFKPLQHVAKINKLLYIGRIDELKGLLVLLEALHILKQNGKLFKLTIIGSGEEDFLRKIRSYIIRHNLEEEVDFFEYMSLNELWEYYANSDIFVLPTLAENLSRTIWEAMSQGCPVITTPVGGQGRAFTNKEDVLFIEPNNALDLSDRIVELTSNITLRNHLSFNGIERAAGNTIENRTLEMMTEIKNWLA